MRGALFLIATKPVNPGLRSFVNIKTQQGKQVRFMLHKTFSDRSDMFLHCYRFWSPGHDPLPKAVVTDVFRRSIFCFLPAGDTPSSHRVPEALALGCIPVIVGPPFSFLPLPAYIPWKDVALTFYVEELDKIPPRELDTVFQGGNLKRPKPADYDLQSGEGKRGSFTHVAILLCKDLPMFR